MATVLDLVLVAQLLRGGITHTGCDAVLKVHLADEGRHGLGIVLEARYRAVGATGTVENQIVRIAIVGAGIATAKGATSIDLTIAPVRSRARWDTVGINGRIGGGLRSDEAG